MALGFQPSARRGEHYDLATFAVRRLKKVNVLVKGKTERHFEHTIISHLQASPKLRKNLITQIGVDEVEKITPGVLFGFSHRPDVSIGHDGTAIEIKVVSSGHGVRDILGQAIAYRMHYRFVILVLIDKTAGKKIVDTCQSKASSECCLLSGLAEKMNVFTIIGPVGPSKNLAFVA